MFDHLHQVLVETSQKNYIFLRLFTYEDVETGVHELLARSFFPTLCSGAENRRFHIYCGGNNVFCPVVL